MISNSPDSGIPVSDVPGSGIMISDSPDSGIPASDLPGSGDKPESQGGKVKQEPQDTIGPFERKRRAGIIARENLSMLAVTTDEDIYGVESSGDEQPVLKRPKTSAQASTKNSRKHERKGDKGIFIGIHVEDPELPIYARYYPNGSLNARVYREDCSEAVIARWQGFFASKAQCTMEKIKLDPVLFKDDTIDIQNLGTEEKKQRIRQYLAANGIHPPAASRVTTDKPAEASLESEAQSYHADAPLSRTRKATAEQAKARLAAVTTAPSKSKAPVSSQDNTSTTANSPEKTAAKQPATADCTVSDLHVGFWITNLSLPVYAYIKAYPSRNSTAVCYRLHKADADEETIRSASYPRNGAAVRFDDIKFKDNFIRRSHNATRACIKAVLSNEPEPEEIDGRFGFTILRVIGWL